MGDNAFSLPTLLVLAPAAGGLIAMSMVTRRAAAIVSMLTMLIQAALIVVGAVQLDRYADRFGGSQLPSCSEGFSRKGADVVLAQCTDWFPQWGIEYHVVLGWGALGLIALTTLVTFCATMFSTWVGRDRPAPMLGLMWLSAASLCGLFVARDLVLFYVFFELMLVPLLVLVGVWGEGPTRIRATMTMFVYTLFGSLPMLVGVVATGLAANGVIERLAESGAPEALAGQQLSPFSLTTLSALVHSGELHLPGWVLATFLLAFAVKAPLMPLHGWLPLAYRTAPVEVTAMLSGLVSKAAFFGVLVVVLPLFPGLLDGGWGTALTWVSVATLLVASLQAFRQPDARGVVAYSSLAQMGLILLGLSTFLGAGGGQGVAGAYLQTINHGLVSAGLFLLVGIIEARTGERTFARMGGLATGRPALLSIGLVLTMIALAVPGASTFGGELLVLAGAFRGLVSGPLVAALASIGVVLAAMYALRLVAAFAFTSDEEVREAGREGGTRFGGDLRAREVALLAPIVGVLLLLAAWPNLLRRPMNQPPVPIATVDRDPAAKGKDEHDAPVKVATNKDAGAGANIGTDPADRRTVTLDKPDTDGADG